MHSDDDAELEVSELDERAPDPRSWWPLGVSSGGFWTHAARARRRRGLATAVLVLGAFLCVLASIPGGWQSLAAVLHLGTGLSAAVSAPVESFISLQDGVPWGQLTLDGRPVTRSEIIQGYTGFEPPGTLLALAPGRHVVEYTAPPFTALRCWLSVPRTNADTCPLARAVTADRRVRTLDLGASPDHLASSALDALEEAVALEIAGAASSAPVTSGERVRLADGTPQAATVPLAASLSYSRVAGVAGQVSDSAALALGACASLCRIGNDAYIGAVAEQPLALMVAVTLQWRYTPSESGLSFDGAAAGPGQSAAGLLRLDLHWDGAWRVARPPGPVGSVPCTAGVGLLSATTPSLAAQGTFGLVPAPQDAAGCLMLWRSCGDPVAFCPGGTPASPAVVKPAPGAATFLYRFGLLFAANAAAHALVPALPMPNAAERAADLHIWGAPAAA